MRFIIKALAVATLTWVGAAGAQGVVGAEGSVGAASVESAGRTLEGAQALLSQRYAARWAGLSPDERLRFSARERQWLNSGRWQEKDACVAERGAGSGAQCLLEVTLRHAQGLDRLRASN